MSLLRNPSHEELKRAPKVVLHDHLDGALRISTIIEISKEIGYTALPSYEPDVGQMPEKSDEENPLGCHCHAQ